ncbi:MAG: DUF3280 domain-containing protein [Pseudolabrys sp.]
MGFAWWAIAVPALLAAPVTMSRAAVRPVAVFNFELIDTSLDGAVNGPRADEAARITEVSDGLRDWLAGQSGLRVVDIAPVAKEAAAAHLQACGGCDADLARQVGAELSVTGTVQKVSNLILNMTIYVRSIASGRVIAVNADMRGNTAESWMHTLRWLERNRLAGALMEAAP